MKTTHKQYIVWCFAGRGGGVGTRCAEFANEEEAIEEMHDSVKQHSGTWGIFKCVQIAEPVTDAVNVTEFFAEDIEDET